MNAVSACYIGTERGFALCFTSELVASGWLVGGSRMFLGFFLLKLLPFHPSLSRLTPHISNISTVSRIRAIRTSASDGLEGFKAHAVFQEINKKLQEVITLHTS